MSTIRLVGGTSPVDARPRSAARLPGWMSALMILSAAAIAAIAVLAAVLGIFAALRIAHGYGAALDRPPVAAFGPNVWPHPGAAGRIVSVPAEPRVVARSDPVEIELAPETASGRIETIDEPTPAGIARSQEPREAAASAAPDPAEDKTSGGVDRAALAPIADASGMATPSHTKPHAAIKRHAVRKRVRRVARRAAYFGTTASFGARTNQLQPKFRSARRASSAGASPFQPIFGSP